LVQERVGNTLKVIGIGKDFLKRHPEAQQLRERMDKWDFIKLKSFCSTKLMLSKLKRQPIEWEEIFASYTSRQGTDNQNIQGTQKLNSLKINGYWLIKKWATELNRSFSKEEIQIAKKHIKNAHLL
jgi:hypothetical protein